MDEILALFTAFHVGALAGCIALVNFLVNITKLPGFSQNPRLKVWRPVLALALGVGGAILSAVQAGKTDPSALLAAVFLGVNVGGGAVALHEVWHSVTTYARYRGWIKITVMVTLLLNLSACTFMERAGKGVQTCVENDPALVSQVAQALANAAEGNWIAAVVALVPDPVLRKCIIQALVDATKAEKSVPLTSAKELTETPQQRLSRRANAYLMLVQ